MRPSVRVVVSCGLALCAACGGSPETPPAPPAPPGLSLERIASAADAYAAGATAIDLDGDGRAEWQLEGRIGAGLPTRETMDPDGDGTANLVWESDGPDLVFRIDRNGDGTFEYTKRATPDPAGATTAVVTEDTNGDFRVDHRMTLTRVPGTSLVGIAHEFDDDRNGTYERAFSTVSDQGAKRVPGAAAFAVAPAALSGMRHVPVTVETTGPAACTAAQAEQLRNALDDAVSRGASCLAPLDPHLALALARVVATRGVRMNCGRPSSCGYAANAQDFCLFGCAVVIELGPDSFDPATCGDLTSTVFHELLHYAAELHQYDDGTSDLGDRVYGCEKTCFGAGTSITCAACLGTANGNSRCGGYTAEACPATLASNCPCGPCRKARQVRLVEFRRDDSVPGQPR